MGRHVCTLDTNPRVSGRLWTFDGTETKRFSVNGVASVEVSDQGKILEVCVKSGERIIGAEFNSENHAALWTEKGNIYKLNFGQNSYWKVGKPGVVSCASFLVTPPHHLMAGLTTGRAVVIDTVTGAIRCRFVENCDILRVGSSHDGLVVFTMCRDHVTMWDISTKQARYRLGLQPGDHLQFVSILQRGSEDGYRVVTATMHGKLGVWGMDSGASTRTKIITKEPKKLVMEHEAVIGDTLDGFSLIGNNLYVAIMNKIVRVDLESGNSDKLKSFPGHEKVLDLDAKVVGNQLFTVLHFAQKSSFMKNSEIVNEIYCFGPGSFSHDGFIMVKVKPDGSVEFFRTDDIWGKAVDKVDTVDRASGIATATTSDKASATTDKATVDLRTVKLVGKQVNAHSVFRRDPTKVGSVTSKESNIVKQSEIVQQNHEELLAQITSPTLLPLLRSGLLSYPPNPRPTIWTRLLQLPRKKRLYLKFCKSNDTSPDEVIHNLMIWSPHLNLIPHIKHFLSPFLKLFSGHPTTSFEFCLTILTKFSWLSFYPSSPPVLFLAWSLLSSEFPDLINHLTSISVNSRNLFWPLLQTGWSSVLPYTDWIRLWDHFITAGPDLLVIALPATIICLKSILLSCTSSNMVDNLISNQPAINIDELLQTSYTLLDKYWSRVARCLEETPVCGITDSGYPPPISLGREGEEVLKNINKYDSDLNKSPLHDDFKNPNPYSKVVKQALHVSPPPLPRVRSNQRNELNKENLGPGPVMDKQSFQPVRHAVDPMAPLKPAYPTMQALPPYDGDEGGLEEDITGLLQKAKLLRAVIQAKM